MASLGEQTLHKVGFLSEEEIEWLRSHPSKRVSCETDALTGIVQSTISFESADDAMLFKLTFGGAQ